MLNLDVVTDEVYNVITSFAVDEQIGWLYFLI